MSGLHFMPFYVDDYEGNTSHLTIEEDGFYMRLLRLLWRSPGCSIPDDMNWIIRKMRIDQETYYRIGAPLIDEFCSRRNGKIFQKRLLSEWQKAFSKYEARKLAGKKGGEAKALKEKQNKSGKARGLSYQPELQPQPQPELHKKDNKDGALGTVDRREQSIVDFKNRRMGRKY